LAIEPTVAAFEGGPGGVCVYGSHQHGPSIGSQFRSRVP
jgi:hypothetical protein